LLFGESTLPYFNSCSCSESRKAEIAKAHEGFVAIAEVHKQVEVMNARHADGIEALQKEHTAEMSKLWLQAEATREDAMTRSKNFNELVEQTTKQVKSKEKEVE
jgi:hypothetical protein